MARHRHRGARTTPKGTRPAHLHSVRDSEDASSPIDALIDGAANDILQKDDPVAAETWASGMSDVFESARRKARLAGQDVPPFEEALLERCWQRRDRKALAVAACMAAVLPPPFDELGRRVVDDLGRSVAGPTWLDTVGQAKPTQSQIASDVFGDQDTLIVGFTQPGRPREHAVVVLVDHNVSGQAKDAWIASDFDKTVDAWKSATDPHMRIEETPIAEALVRLRQAMAMSDVWSGDSQLRTEDFAQHRALVWARLRRSGHGEEHPESDLEIPQPERDSIVAEFLASAPGRAALELLPRADVEMLGTSLVNLRCDHEGRPLRWSPTVVTMLLIDLAPRKLLVHPDQTASLPPVMQAFVRFASERTGLQEVFVEEILAAVDDAAPEFLERMSDPSSAGPAKAILTSLQARGLDLSDLEAVKATLEDLGPMTPPKQAPKRKRKSTEAPVEIVGAAERAPVIARFAALVNFYGDGRKLTQTGQPTLADARALIELLGTDDRFDERIGNRTYKTRSAAELPELGFMIRWAVTSGALRKEHGKLRATASWRTLDGRPLQKWLKAADALPSLGPLAGFHGPNRYRHPKEILDTLVPEILHALHGKVIPFDTVLDWICERADATYEWLAPFMQDPDHRRLSFGRDLDRLTRILGWARIVERVGATTEPDRWDSMREQLVGGSLELTPVGRWWLGDPGQP